jgi:methyl-branched lipid omega-hydroxylase
MGVVTRINGARPPLVPLADIDLGSWDFWLLDDDMRDGAFATLRREAPITFHREAAQDGVAPGKGHWALTRYSDIFHASRHPEIFSSRPTITLYDDPPEVAELLGSMIVLDDPRHRSLRNVVSRAFTPKVIASTEASVRHRARGLIESMVANHPDGQADLVAELAGPLPVQVVCDVMGIPEGDHATILEWADRIMSVADPDLATDGRFANMLMEMGAYANALANDRSAHPRDDLLSAMATAEVDGEPLTSGEIASFFRMLVIAGSESTRYALSHGVLALTHYPDERQRWWADFDGLAHSAVEEILRWTSPVMYMRRTLTQDTELSGTRMAAGDKVTMWYSSANRDDAKFADPWTFDVRRGRQPHFGFGGGGAHFCVGAHLARQELRVAFGELRRQISDIVATEEPSRLLSAFVHGIESLPVAWTPPR